jgi:pyridoxine kinase
MRALGVRVAEIPTVLLSNAPFYDTTRGRVLPADWFADLLLGTHERGLPQRAKMLVSGYFGSTSNGAAFADWLDDILPACPQLRYCLDPVIGDTHTGPYVEPGLEAIFAERLLPHAWLVTPNAFELNRLTGMPALAEADAIAAARTLLDRGPHWVIAHSVGGTPGELVTLAVGREETWRWTSPLLPVDVAGTGDVLMSLVVSFLLRGESMQQAISRAIAGTHAALEATLDNGFEEFDVIAAAPAALAEGTRFRAERVA